MASADRSRGRRPRRWRLRAIVLLITAIGIAVAAVAFFPNLTVGFIAKRVLERNGLGPVTLEIADLGLDRLVVDDIRLGPGPDLSIAKVTVEFGLFDLIRRRVGRVVVDNPVISGRIGPGNSVAELAASFSLGVLDRIVFATGSEGAGGLSAWPALAITDGHVRLATPLGPIEALFDGSAEADGAVHVSVVVAGTNFVAGDAALRIKTLKVEMKRGAEGKLHAVADINIPAITSADYQFEKLALALSYDENEGVGKGAANISLARLRLPGQDVDDFFGALPQGVTQAFEEDALRPFADALKGEMKRALADARLRAKGRLVRDADGFHVMVDEPVVVDAPATPPAKKRAAAIAAFSLTQLAPDRPLVSLRWDDDRRAQLAGQLDVSGAALPDFKAVWDGSVQFAAPQTAIAAPAVQFFDFPQLTFTLAPWTAGGRTLALQDLKIGIKSNRVTSLGDISGSLKWDGMASTGLSFANSRLTLDGRYRYEGGRLSYQQRGTGCAILDSDEILLSGFALHRSQVQMCAKEEEPLLRILLSDKGPTEIQLNVHVAPGLATLDAPNGLHLRGLFPEMDLYSEYMPAAGDWRLTFGLLNGALLLPGDTGSIADLRLTGLVSAKAGSALEIEAGLDGLTLRDALEVPRYAPISLTGSLRLSNALAHFDGEAASPAGTAIAQLTAEHRLDVGTGFFRIKSNGLDFQPKSLEIDTLLPILSGVVTNAKGRVDFSGEFVWTDQSVTSGGSITLADVGFTSRVAIVSGIDANIMLSSLSPLTTPQSQVVQIRNIDAGVDLAMGSISFSLDPQKGVVIDGASWPWSGGTIGLAPGELALDQPVQKLALVAADIDIQQVFTLLDVDGLIGTGTAEGTMPLAISDGMVMVQNGRLVSTGQGGTVRYTGSVGAAATKDQGSALLFDALKDFTYDRLEVGINGPLTGELAVTVTLEGRNPAVLNGYPMKLKVSAEGPLGEMIRKGTIGYRIPEQIRNQLGGENKGEQ